MSTRNLSEQQASVVIVESDPDVLMARNIFVFVLLSYVPLIITANSLVFWATVLYPAFHTSTNYLLCSLSVTDLLTAVLTIPMYVLAYTVGTQHLIHDHKYACLAWCASGVLTVCGSLIHMLVIALDRYLAVAWPLCYRSQVTASRMKKLLMALWLYLLIYSSVPFLGWNNYPDGGPLQQKQCDFYLTLPKYYILWAMSSNFLLCAIIPVVLYLRIAFIIFKQKRFLHQRPELKYSCSETNRLRAHVVSIKITFALTSLFFLFWLPYLGVLVLKVLQLLSHKQFQILRCMAMLVAMANSMINALIYARGKADYKEAYWLMLTNWPWKWREMLQQHWRQRASSNMASTDTRPSTSRQIVQFSSQQGDVTGAKLSLFQVSQVSFEHLSDTEPQKPQSIQEIPPQ